MNLNATDNDMTAVRPRMIAYLAPEIPALSATFVYEELLALERLGYAVLPITVRLPSHPAQSQEALAARTLCLYDRSPIRLILSGFFGLLRFKTRVFKAVSWLWADLRVVGFKLQGLKLIFQFLVAVKLARLLKQHQCQILHVHFAHVPAQIAMYASALSAIPFTVMAHANDIFERGLLLQQKAERARKFLTISEFNRQYLLDLGLDARQLALVRCGVSLKMYSPPPATNNPVVFKFGSLGRLVEKKGFDVLIDAVSLLKAKGCSVCLEIAGDGSLRETLLEQVKRLGLDQEVSFVGALPHDQVGIWLQGLDAFVLACKPDRHGDMDGIPVVLMEAMSQAIPVVSTRLTGIPELVVDGETGLLAEQGDRGSLAEKMEALLTDPALRQRLVRESQGHLASEFGQSVNLHRLLVTWELDFAHE